MIYKKAFIQMGKNSVCIGPFLVAEKNLFLCIQSVEVNEPLFRDNKNMIFFCNVHKKYDSSCIWEQQRKSVDDNKNTLLSILKQNEFRMCCYCQRKKINRHRMKGNMRKLTFTNRQVVAKDFMSLRVLKTNFFKRSKYIWVK